MKAQWCIHITGELAENGIVSTSCHQVLLNQNAGNIADALYAGQAWEPWIRTQQFQPEALGVIDCLYSRHHGFMLLHLIFLPFASLQSTLGQSFCCRIYSSGKKSFANKYGLCKLLLSLFTNGSVTRLAFVLSQLFSNIKWYYVSCWFSSIPSFCKIEKKCRVELLISHMNHALMCCILSLCRTSYLFCYSVIPSTLLLVEIPAFCLSPHIHINRA